MVLQNPNINQIVIQAFEDAKQDIRMEEPIRLLTRFAFKLIKIIFATNNHESHLTCSHT